MSEAKPTLIPPSSAISETSAAQPTLTPNSGAAGGGVGTAQPTLTPSSGAAQGGVGAWLNDKRVGALWSINQNRNSWAYITNVGWKKFADNSDSAIMALTALATHAKQTQTNFSYREEADGKIHEVYVW